MPISRLRPMRYTWLYPVSSSVSMCIMRRVITKYLIFLYCFSYISNIFYFVPQMDEICSVFQFSVVIQHNCQVHRVPEIKTTTKCLGCLSGRHYKPYNTHKTSQGGGRGGQSERKERQSAPVSGVTQDKPRQCLHLFNSCHLVRNVGFMNP